MAEPQAELIADAIAARKREKQALIREFQEHNRKASPNHTADCCLWCTNNADALMALDNQIEDLTKQLRGATPKPSPP